MSDLGITIDQSVDGPVASRREWLFGGMFALAAATAWLRKPSQKVSFLGDHKIEALVPLSFAGWNFVTASGLVLPPKDQLSQLVYEQTLTRRYVNAAGTEIMLLIAYAPQENGIVQIHRPEVCYPASGYQVTKLEEHVSNVGPGIAIPSRFLVCETPIRRESIVYWTRLGNDFPRKWSEQRLDIFEQNLEGLIPDGLLFRLSSTSQSVGVDQFDDFARALYANVSETMKRVMVGSRT